MRQNKHDFFKKSKKKQDELNRNINDEGGVGGRDIFAMISSAFLVFMPICLLIILALSFLVLWLFKAI